MRVLFSQGLIAISKPRCGSTSIRWFLDTLIDPSFSDIAVDMAGQRPPFHPHISAPCLKKVLVDQGHDISGMTSFIVTRNPVDMLWSYFHFFAPDRFGLYNYDRAWNPTALMSFEDWVMRGWLGMMAESKVLAPDWVGAKGLYSLNLEAHIQNRQGISEVDHVFLLEEIDKAVEWLSNFTGREVALPHVNLSQRGDVPKIGQDMRDRIVAMFPMESKIYGL